MKRFLLLLGVILLFSGGCGDSREGSLSGKESREMYYCGEYTISLKSGKELSVKPLSNTSFQILENNKELAKAEYFRAESIELPIDCGFEKINGTGYYIVPEENEFHYLTYLGDAGADTGLMVSVDDKDKMGKIVFTGTGLKNIKTIREWFQVSFEQKDRNLITFPDESGFFLAESFEKINSSEYTCSYVGEKEEILTLSCYGINGENAHLARDILCTSIYQEIGKENVICRNERDASYIKDNDTYYFLMENVTGKRCYVLQFQNMGLSKVKKICRSFANSNLVTNRNKSFHFENFED